MPVAWPGSGKQTGRSSFQRSAAWRAQSRDRYQGTQQPVLAITQHAAGQQALALPAPGLLPGHDGTKACGLQLSLVWGEEHPLNTEALPSAIRAMGSWHSEYFFEVSSFMDEMLDSLVGGMECRVDCDGAMFIAQFLVLVYLQSILHTKKDYLQRKGCMTGCFAHCEERCVNVAIKLTESCPAVPMDYFIDTYKIGYRLIHGDLWKALWSLACGDSGNELSSVHAMTLFAQGIISRCIGEHRHFVAEFRNLLLSDTPEIKITPPLRRFVIDHLARPALIEPLIDEVRVGDFVERYKFLDRKRQFRPRPKFVAATGWPLSGNDANIEDWDQTLDLIERFHQEFPIRDARALQSLVDTKLFNPDRTWGHVFYDLFAGDSQAVFCRKIVLFWNRKGKLSPLKDYLLSSIEPHIDGMDLSVLPEDFAAIMPPSLKKAENYLMNSSCSDPQTQALTMRRLLTFATANKTRSCTRQDLLATLSNITRKRERGLEVYLHFLLIFHTDASALTDILREEDLARPLVGHRDLEDANFYARWRDDGATANYRAVCTHLSKEMFPEAWATLHGRPTAVVYERIRRVLESCCVIESQEVRGATVRQVKGLRRSVLAEILVSRAVQVPLDSELLSAALAITEDDFGLVGLMYSAHISLMKHAEDHSLLKDVLGKKFGAGGVWPTRLKQAYDKLASGEMRREDLPPAVGKAKLYLENLHNLMRKEFVKTLRPEEGVRALCKRLEEKVGGIDRDRDSLQALMLCIKRHSGRDEPGGWLPIPDVSALNIEGPGGAEEVFASHLKKAGFQREVLSLARLCPGARPSRVLACFLQSLLPRDAGQRKPEQYPGILERACWLLHSQEGRDQLVSSELCPLDLDELTKRRFGGEEREALAAFYAESLAAQARLSPSWARSAPPPEGGETGYAVFLDRFFDLIATRQNLTHVTSIRRNLEKLGLGKDHLGQELPDSILTTWVALQDGFQGKNAAEVEAAITDCLRPPGGSGSQVPVSFLDRLLQICVRESVFFFFLKNRLLKQHNDFEGRHAIIIQRHQGDEKVSLVLNALKPVYNMIRPLMLDRVTLHDVTVSLAKVIRESRQGKQENDGDAHRMKRSDELLAKLAENIRGCAEYRHDIESWFNMELTVEQAVPLVQSLFEQSGVGHASFFAEYGRVALWRVGQHGEKRQIGDSELHDILQVVRLSRSQAAKGAWLLELFVAIHGEVEKLAKQMAVLRGHAHPDMFGIAAFELNLPEAKARLEAALGGREPDSADVKEEFTKLLPAATQMESLDTQWLQACDGARKQLSRMRLLQPGHFLKVVQQRAAGDEFGLFSILWMCFPEARREHLTKALQAFPAGEVPATGVGQEHLAAEPTPFQGIGLLRPVTHEGWEPLRWRGFLKEVTEIAIWLMDAFSHMPTSADDPEPVVTADTPRHARTAVVSELPASQHLLWAWISELAKPDFVHPSEVFQCKPGTTWETLAHFLEASTIAPNCDLFVMDPDRLPSETFDLLLQNECRAALEQVKGGTVHFLFKPRSKSGRKEQFTFLHEAKPILKGAYREAVQKMMHDPAMGGLQRPCLAVLGGTREGKSCLITQRIAAVCEPGAAHLRLTVDESWDGKRCVEQVLRQVEKGTPVALHLEVSEFVQADVVLNFAMGLIVDGGLSDAEAGTVLMWPPEAKVWLFLEFQRVEEDAETTLRVISSVERAESMPFACDHINFGFRAASNVGNIAMKPPRPCTLEDVKRAVRLASLYVNDPATFNAATQYVSIDTYPLPPEREWPALVQSLHKRLDVHETLQLHPPTQKGDVASFWKLFAPRCHIYLMRQKFLDGYKQINRKMGVSRHEAQMEAESNEDRFRVEATMCLAITGDAIRPEPEMPQGIFGCKLIVPLHEIQEDVWCQFEEVLQWEKLEGIDYPDWIFLNGAPKPSTFTASSGIEPKELMCFAEDGAPIPEKDTKRSILPTIMGSGLNICQSLSGLLRELNFVLTTQFAARVEVLSRFAGVRQNVILRGDTGVGKTEVLHLFKNLMALQLDGSSNPRPSARVEWVVELLKGHGLLGQDFGLTGQEDVNQAKAEIGRQLKKSLHEDQPEIDVGRVQDEVRRWFDEHKLLKHSENIKRLIDGDPLMKFAEPLFGMLWDAVTCDVDGLFHECCMHEAFPRERLLSLVQGAVATSLKPEYRAVTILLFVDETNTTQHLRGMLKELFCDRLFLGEPLPDNILVVGAVNPYSPDFVVRELPKSMDALILDYGALTEEQEQEFLHCCMGPHTLREELKKAIVDAVQESQNFCRQLIREGRMESRIRVSIRDILRFYSMWRDFRSHEFFCSVPPGTAAPGGWALQDVRDMRAALLALTVAYYFRFKTSDEDSRAGQGRDATAMRNQYLDRLQAHFGHIGEFHESGGGPNFQQWRDIYGKELDIVIDSCKLSRETAKYRILKENLFCMATCMANNIPCYIAGPPGLSKTYSFSVMFDSMRGQNSESDLMKSLPRLEKRHFQGSELSTAEEVRFIFSIAKDAQAKLKHEKAAVVVLVDEAGLPVERHNALKALHVELDHPEVRCVLLSNTILDAAKTNRAALIYQDRLDYNDHKDLVMGCLRPCSGEDDETDDDEEAQGGTTFNVTKLVHEIIDFFAALQHHEQFKRMHNMKSECMFHLRDLIFFTRHLRDEHFIMKLESRDTKAAAQVLREALVRNFGGMDLDLMARMLDMAFARICHGGWKHGAKNFARCCGDDGQDEEAEARELASVVLQSMCKSFVRQLRDGEDISHSSFRYLFLVDPTSTGAVLDLLGDVLAAVPLPRTSLTVCCFPCDASDHAHTSLLGSIQQELQKEDPTLIVLTNPLAISSALYDVWNRYFQAFRNDRTNTTEYLANVALGAISRPCCVNVRSKFMLVQPQVHLERIPVPMYSRFEKFYVSADLLRRSYLRSETPDMQRRVEALRATLQGFVDIMEQHPFLYGYTEEETISSLLLWYIHSCKSLAKKALPKFFVGGGADGRARERSFADITDLDTAKQLLLFRMTNLATPEAMLKKAPELAKSDEFRHVPRDYFRYQEHFGVVDLLHSLVGRLAEGADTCPRKWVVFTRGSPDLTQLVLEARTRQRPNLLEAEFPQESTVIHVKLLANMLTQDDCNKQVSAAFKARGGNAVQGVLVVLCDMQGASLEMLQHVISCIHQEHTLEACARDDVLRAGDVVEVTKAGLGPGVEAGQQGVVVEWPEEGPIQAELGGRTLPLKSAAGLKKVKPRTKPMLGMCVVYPSGYLQPFSRPNFNSVFINEWEYAFVDGLRVRKSMAGFQRLFDEVAFEQEPGRQEEVSSRIRADLEGLVLEKAEEELRGTKVSGLQMPGNARHMVGSAAQFMALMQPLQKKSVILGVLRDLKDSTTGKESILGGVVDRVQGKLSGDKLRTRIRHIAIKVLQGDYSGQSLISMLMGFVQGKIEKFVGKVVSEVIKSFPVSADATLGMQKYTVDEQANLAKFLYSVTVWLPASMNFPVLEKRACWLPLFFPLRVLIGQLLSAANILVDEYMEAAHEDVKVLLRKLAECQSQHLQPLRVLGGTPAEGIEPHRTAFGLFCRDVVETEALRAHGASPGRPGEAAGRPQLSGVLARIIASHVRRFESLPECNPFHVVLMARDPTLQTAAALLEACFAAFGDVTEGVAEVTLESVMAAVAERLLPKEEEAARGVAEQLVDPESRARDTLGVAMSLVSLPVFQSMDDLLPQWRRLLLLDLSLKHLELDAPSITKAMLHLARLPDVDLCLKPHVVVKRTSVHLVRALDVHAPPDTNEPAGAFAISPAARFTLELLEWCVPKEAGVADACAVAKLAVGLASRQEDLRPLHLEPRQLNMVLRGLGLAAAGRTAAKRFGPFADAPDAVEEFWQAAQADLARQGPLGYRWSTTSASSLLGVLGCLRMEQRMDELNRCAEPLASAIMSRLDILESVKDNEFERSIATALIIKGLARLFLQECTTADPGIDGLSDADVQRLRQFLDSEDIRVELLCNFPTPKEQVAAVMRQRRIGTFEMRGTESAVREAQVLANMFTFVWNEDASPPLGKLALGLEHALHKRKAADYLKDAACEDPALAWASDYQRRFVLGAVAFKVQALPNAAVRGLDGVSLGALQEEILAVLKDPPADLGLQEDCDELQCLRLLAGQEDTLRAPLPAARARELRQYVEGLCRDGTISSDDGLWPRKVAGFQGDFDSEYREKEVLTLWRGEVPASMDVRAVWAQTLCFVASTPKASTFLHAGAPRCLPMIHAGRHHGVGATWAVFHDCGYYGLEAGGTDPGILGCPDHFKGSRLGRAVGTTLQFAGLSASMLVDPAEVVNVRTFFCSVYLQSDYAGDSDEERAANGILAFFGRQREYLEVELQRRQGLGVAQATGLVLSRYWECLCESEGAPQVPGEYRRPQFKDMTELKPFQEWLQEHLVEPLLGHDGVSRFLDDMDKWTRGAALQWEGSTAEDMRKAKNVMVERMAAEAARPSNVSLANISEFLPPEVPEGAEPSYEQLCHRSLLKYLQANEEVLKVAKYVPRFSKLIRWLTAKVSRELRETDFLTCTLGDAARLCTTREADRQDFENKVGEIIGIAREIKAAVPAFDICRRAGAAGEGEMMEVREETRLVFLLMFRLSPEGDQELENLLGINSTECTKILPRMLAEVINLHNKLAGALPGDIGLSQLDPENVPVGCLLPSLRDIGFEERLPLWLEAGGPGAPRLDVGLAMKFILKHVASAVQVNAKAVEHNSTYVSVKGKEKKMLDDALIKNVLKRQGEAKLSEIPPVLKDLFALVDAVIPGVALLQVQGLPDTLDDLEQLILDTAGVRVRRIHRLGGEAFVQLDRPQQCNVLARERLDGLLVTHGARLQARETLGAADTKRVTALGEHLRSSGHARDAAVGIAEELVQVLQGFLEELPNKSLADTARIGSAALCDIAGNDSSLMAYPGLDLLPVASLALMVRELFAVALSDDSLHHGHTGAFEQTLPQALGKRIKSCFNSIDRGNPEGAPRRATRQFFGEVLDLLAHPQTLLKVRDAPLEPLGVILEGELAALAVRRAADREKHKAMLQLLFGSADPECVQGCHTMQVRRTLVQALGQLLLARSELETLQGIWGKWEELVEKVHARALACGEQSSEGTGQAEGGRARGDATPVQDQADDEVGDDDLLACFAIGDDEED